ncbi:hypothetical protein NC651_033923 [Populus alba x Populus x berolinensis]|nr:hypothetical protein NC651_033923 [Populus alba x Populus x berolinensis]
MADFRQQTLRPGGQGTAGISLEAGLTLVGTLTGLAVATPTFLFF